MDTKITETLVVPDPTTKPRRNFHPKIVAAAVVGLIATGIAVVIKTQKSDETPDQVEEGNYVIEPLES